jgi:hypothetical protein
MYESRTPKAAVAVPRLVVRAEIVRVRLRAFARQCRSGAREWGSRLSAAVLMAAVLCAAVLWTGVAQASSQMRKPADTPGFSDIGDIAPLPRGFDTFDAGWLHLSYAPSLSRWVEPLIQEAQAFRTEVSLRLGQQVLSKVRVRLAEDPSQMATLAPVGAPYPNYAVGVAYGKLGLILLTDTPVHPNAEHDLLATFRHELAHLALEEAVQGNSVPLWFNEGLAVHLSRERAFGRTQTLWTAVVSGNLLPLADIEHHFPDDIVGVPLAYAQSADVVRYLLRQEDQTRFRSLISRLRKGQTFPTAMVDAYGLDEYTLERVWRAEAESRYTVWPVLMSGTLVWGGAIVLSVFAWRRKKGREEKTLRRWAREEALDELRRLRALAEKERPLASISPSVPSPGAPPPPPGAAADQQGPVLNWGETPVPRVEHDGNWHTLH